MNEVRGAGRAIFAGVYLMIAGVLNIIYGIAAISNSHVFVHNAHYVFGDLKSWGWVTLIIGILELFAALSLFGGGGYGVWFAVFVAGLAAIEWLLQIPAYPLLSIAMFALAIWIINGLIKFASDVRAAQY
jgi:hypothetical protein